MKTLALGTLGLLFALGCTDNKRYFYATPDLSGVSPVAQDLSVPSVCTAMSRECVDASTFHVCHADGSWGTDQPCPVGNSCDKGACSPDVNAVPCQVGDGSCVQGMAVTCKKSGVGFDVKACPANTACTGAGLCIGGCGAVGATTCHDPSHLDSCDGNVVTRSACPAPGADGRRNFCVTLSDGSAACMPSDCDPIDGCDVCGNPTISTVSATANLSSCRETPLGYQWSTSSCAAPTTCNPAAPGTCSGGPGNGASCTAQCTPGATVCLNAASIETCGTDGTWGPVTLCDATLSERCSTKFGGVARCVDRICAQNNVTGVCVDDATTASKIQLCDATGHLSGAPVACSSGACAATAAAVNGQIPGACRVACQPGESRCVLGSAIQPCVDGLWSAQTTSCLTDGSAASCQIYTTDTPPVVQQAICGVCSPGAHRCVDGGGTVDAGAQLPYIETCLPTGQWSAQPTLCAIGYCHPSGGDASCTADCLPGAPVCLGGPQASPSPVPLTFGTLAAGTCSTDGRLPPTPVCPSADPSCCAAATSCRTDQALHALGCVACVGGLNEVGLVDTRCSSANGAAQLLHGPSVQICRTDSAGWQAPTSCGALSCIDGPPAHCGALPAGLALWLRADTGVVTDGSGFVQRWIDQSGNGRDAVPPNFATDHPLLVTGAMNGLPALRFNGTSNKLHTVATMPGGADPYAIFVVVNQTTSGDRGFIGWGTWGSGNKTVAFRQLGTNQLRTYWWGNDLDVSTTTTGKGLFETTWDLTTRETLRNGVVLGSDHPSGKNTTATVAEVGATNNDSELLQGDLAEILVYDAALSDADRSAVEAYLRAKYQLY